MRTRSLWRVARGPSAAVLLLCAALAATTRAFSAPQDAAGTQGSSAPAQAFNTWLDAEATRALAAGARARAQATTADAVRRRADDVRREIVAAIGGLPDERAALNARITGAFERDGYRVEHLVFESLPGFFVTANVYVPTRAAGPFPAVLGTAGHSDAGKAEPIYQHAWVGLARRGILVLAYDPPGQGERLEYYDPASGGSRVGIGTREHTHVGQQCLLTGTSIARYFAWDGIRALDYLRTRKDVDADRIGVAGNSGGGTQAAWLGAVEPRLSAVVSSCYITSWERLWSGPGPQDMEQVLPGMLARGLDFPDMILAAARRPYLVSSAIQDYFPVDGARATVAEARRMYAALGAGERIGHAENDGEHGWAQPLREAAYRWFGRWWLDSTGTDADGEGNIAVEPAEALRATPTGQLATSLRSRTIFDLNADRARALAKTRKRADASQLRRLLGIPEPLPAPEIARQSASPADGLRTERVTLQSVEGLSLPGTLIHPSRTPRGTVLVADGRESESAAAEAGSSALARRWAERGYLALALDVRGVGVFAPTRQAGGYTSDYQLAARAWLLGTSIVACQTRDLLAGLAFLEREGPGTGAERVLHVGGVTAPAGLFAAALHRVTAVHVEEGLTSYQDLAETRDYSAPARVFVPGVLEVTDLPEVMAAAAPATIHLVRPVRADGRAVRDTADLQEAMRAPVPANVRLVLNGSGTAPESGPR